MAKKNNKIKKTVDSKLEKINIENFCECIPWFQIEYTLGKRLYKEFLGWMFCQTVPIGGVYIWDLKRWLNGKKNGLKSRDIISFD